MGVVCYQDSPGFPPGLSSQNRHRYFSVSAVFGRYKAILLNFHFYGFNCKIPQPAVFQEMIAWLRYSNKPYTKLFFGFNTGFFFPLWAARCSCWTTSHEGNWSTLNSSSNLQESWYSVFLVSQKQGRWKPLARGASTQAAHANPSVICKLTLQWLLCSNTALQRGKKALRDRENVTAN